MSKLTPSGGRQMLRLKIGDAPKYPYVGQEFMINIHLVDDVGKLKCGDEIPLLLNLCFQEKPLRPCPDSLITIKNADDLTEDPKNFTISKAGSIRLILCINELSMRHENKKLVFRASTENINGIYVQSAISLPMLCVKYRLVILNNSMPDVWYKDEGGRDKCIELNLALKDHSGVNIVERKVPLKIVLLYGDGNPVLKQEILKISPDSKLMLDAKGQASLRLRIDDVSKNHQKQSFVIQIAPDTVSHPLNNDISPDECAALEVRSKRNKGKRPRDEDPVPTSCSASSSSGSSSGGIANLAAHKIAAKSSQVSAPPAVFPSVLNGGVASATPSASVNSASISPVASSEDLKTVSHSVLEKTALENRRLTELMTNFDKEEVQATAGDAPSREQVGATIAGLVEWSQAVMDAVASLQWQFIGNEKLANGAVRPLYEMQNPNNVITELFGRYHDFAVPALTQLYHSHFSHGGGGREASAAKSSSSSSSASVVRPGYIPLPVPKSSAGMNSFSGLPLHSPLNMNFPSPSHALTSRNELFSNIGKNFSTDSGCSMTSAVMLSLPMPALPLTVKAENSFQPAQLTGPHVPLVHSGGTLARFSSTSSSVSNPSGAPTTMPELNPENSTSYLEDGMPYFAGTTTEEFLQEWSFFDPNNSVGGGGPSGNNFANAFYILGKRFSAKLVTGPLECPAYDMNRKLIGFVVSKADKGSATAASFLPLQEYPANLLTPAEVAEADSIGAELIDANAQGVYLRAYYSDEASFIEAALIHVYEFAEDVNLSK